MRLITFWLFIIFILSVMGVGKIFYHQDNTIDITNITNKMVWNESLYESNIQNTTEDMNLSTKSIVHIKNIIYKGISNLGYIAFEVVKFGVELGYDNPDYNYIWFARIIIYILILCILLSLIPALPIIIALCYLIIVGIKKLIKRFKKNKRQEVF